METPLLRFTCNSDDLCSVELDGELLDEFWEGADEIWFPIYGYMSHQRFVAAKVLVRYGDGWEFHVVPGDFGLRWGGESGVDMESVRRQFEKKWVD